MKASTSYALNTNGTERLLTERQRTHGDYAEVARMTQAMKAMMRTEQGWYELTDAQRESLDMIAVKMARILSGDANCEDHWHDISGYALLPVRR